MKHTQAHECTDQPFACPSILCCQLSQLTLCCSLSVLQIDQSTSTHSLSLSTCVLLSSSVCLSSVICLISTPCFQCLIWFPPVLPNINHLPYPTFSSLLVPFNSPNLSVVSLLCYVWLHPIHISTVCVRCPCPEIVSCSGVVSLLNASSLD